MKHIALFLLLSFLTIGSFAQRKESGNPCSRASVTRAKSVCRLNYDNPEALVAYERQRFIKINNSEKIIL